MKTRSHRHGTHNRHRSALQRLRTARTLTQQDVARLLGVSQQAYSKYETGTVTPSMALQVRLAAILGVSVEALFAPGADTRTEVA